MWRARCIVAIALLREVSKQISNYLFDLYMEVIAPNEELFDFLSDREITWDDDFPIINTLIVKILKGLSEGGVADFLPPLFKDKSDKDFAIELLRKGCA